MIRHAARFLMLLAVAFGVMSMHTLGHAYRDHAPQAEMVLGAPISGMPAAPAALAAAPHTIHAAAASTADVELSAAGVPMPAMDPITVCLAVLTTVGIAVLLAGLLVTRRTGFGGVPEHSPLWTIPGRGPPFAVPALGQRLASLSVSRT